MSGYNLLAHYYDLLTDNVDYMRYASYVDGMFQKFGIDGIVLDAGCGTGTMLRLLLDCGYDMIGADNNEEMLSEAAGKCPGTLLLQQDVTKLDLYGTICGAVSTLDVVNHMESIDAVEKFFSRVALFMEKDGIFIFDLNLPYKHTDILADNAFVFEFSGGMLVWQNRLEDEKGRTKMSLDLFVKQERQRYERTRKTFYE